MEPYSPASYLMLAVLLIAWCALHSAMISIPVTEYLRRHLRERYRFYRLLFNVVAVLTLIPVALFAYSLRIQPIFSWDGYLRIGQLLLLGTALLLFYLGGRQYDAGSFLGIRQIRERDWSKAITLSGKLNTSGILGITRHPWYLGGMLLIWARPLDISALLVNAILTAYLIVGSFLEEKKLAREFGEQYRAYQRQVSMLIPYKWLASRIGSRSRRI